MALGNRQAGNSQRIGAIFAASALFWLALAFAQADAGKDAVPAGTNPTASKPTAAMPVRLPAAANLVYDTSATFHLGSMPITLHSRTTTSWKRDGDHYEAHLHMETGGFDQTSRGDVRAEGMVTPARYSETKPFHSAEVVTIDWPHEQIRFGNSPPVHSPATGAQDRLSLQFELARQRLEFPDRFAPNSTHDVLLIGTHDVDPWKFTVTVEESVATGMGAMRAMRYSAHRTVHGVEETMDIWLGADVDWMPIRIKMVDRNQSIIDSILQKAEIS
jgi:hypothetical protein